MYCYVFLIAVTTKKRLCTVPFAPWTRSRPGVSRSMRRREPRKPPCSRKRSISSWILLKWKPLMIRKEQNLCFDMLRCFLLFLFAWFFFQVFFSLTWMIPKCKWVFWNCAIFDVVLRHKMQLQGLIVETGKGYLAPNMPHGSGDCIPRKLPNQTHPSLDPDPTKFPTYLFPQSRKLHTHIMIPGRDRSEGHPALRTYSSSKETPMIASVPLHCWKRSLLVLRYQSRTQ